MAMSVAVLGAGGNMGRRITGSLKDDDRYQLRLIEPSDRGRARLAELGREAVEQAAGLDGAEVVIFAVPDRIVKEVAAEVIPQLRPRNQHPCSSIPLPSPPTASRTVPTSSAT